MVFTFLGDEKPKVIDEYVADMEKPGFVGKKKNIVISFDGTGGQPEWGLNKEPVPLHSNAGGLSNICKLHLHAGGNIGNSRRVYEDQIACYYSGVGTRGSSNLYKLLVQSTPAYSSGLSMDHIANEAAEDIKQIYRDGDKVFVFGFSRGAATARLFVSHINKNYDMKIAFLGVFDTVLESLKYGLGTSIANMDYGDRKDSSLPECVEKAVHFVAIDEERYNFRPVLFNEDKNVKEIWVPGVHSDAGGGYYHDGISDAVLKCMLMEAEKAGLRWREITKEIVEEQRDTIVCPETNFDTQVLSIFDKDLDLSPDALDLDVHSQLFWLFNIINWMFSFKHRTIGKVRNDEFVPNEPILLLDIAVQRVKELELEEGLSVPSYVSKKYRPENLKGIPYKLVNSKDMSISEKVYDGIELEVDEW